MYKISVNIEALQEFEVSLKAYKLEPVEQGKYKFSKIDRSDRILNAREFIKIYDYLNASHIKFYIEDDDIFLEI